LRDATVRYRSFDRDAVLSVETLEPTDQQWVDFLRVLDSLGVWGWSPEYHDPGVVDGTSWSVEISSGERSLASRGSNRFPPAFEHLLAAVSHLVSGRAFE
jgi:hypothetical protein